MHPLPIMEIATKMSKATQSVAEGFGNVEDSTLGAESLPLSCPGFVGTDYPHPPSHSIITNIIFATLLLEHEDLMHWHGTQRQLCFNLLLSD